MKRVDQAAPPSAAAPKRKKSRGRRKSKAERLARSTPASSSVGDLGKLLQGSSSREWDAAQSLALALGTLEARATVVRVILTEREAPRAAAHYAKRLNLRGEELLSSVTCGSEIAKLLMAQFLVELDEHALSTREKLQRFVWPWLLQSVEKKEDKAALKAAVHLMLHPTASDDAKMQDKKERGLRLQRALVTRCLQTGKLLHLVPTHARSFIDRMEGGSSLLSGAEEDNLDDKDDDKAMDKELQRRQQVARRVQNVLRLMWPDARVLLFGSSITRLLSLTGDGRSGSADVDLCVLLPSAVQFRQETASLVTEGDSSTSLNGSGTLHGLGNQSSAREVRDAERRVKLQHFLVLRAFNLRRSKETLQEQFQSLKKRVESSDPRKDGDFLELDELCAYLSIPPYRRLLLVQVFSLGPQETQIGFDDFVRFLQSAAVRAAQEERQQHEGSLPTPPPRPCGPRQINEALVTFDPTRAHQAVARAPPAPGLWKKREVTIQERITEYTKIDEKGQPQRLVEKERHQTEVLHMESLDGEFAHREITQFEQTEHLNDEMVHLDHGREEFLHLKSRHDEISRFESSVPPGGQSGAGRPEECEQQPPSPSIKRDPSAPGTARESTGFDSTTAAEAEAEAAAYAERWDQPAPEEDAQQT
ncbi:S-M checkpoint control protein CID1 [Phytophthora cinnamomi]|uniref:S-M checkpoint control protein CID1 n=1 Tax=Phytophthora cinnamomi TaxID=4785 RepID=UPI003559B766|nr:S-M checkpoint control protein CID1 [Phytophthora cinnamomi]